jgi:large subunit ribosomal protein L22
MKRKLDESANQAYAKLTSLRISPRKIALVADLIRNMHVQEALLQLNFCKKRVAQDVKKCLLSAVANADNNHSLDIDKLYVWKVYTGKTATMKRFRARAKGRAASIQKCFSNITIIVREN